MKNVVSLPATSSTVRYASRLKTSGVRWTSTEKRLLDTVEFLEAMIIVLNDVKVKNIKDRDYAMAQIVADELKQYEARLQSVTDELNAHRQSFLASVQ